MDKNVLDKSLTSKTYNGFGGIVLYAPDIDPSINQVLYRVYEKVETSPWQHASKEKYKYNILDKDELIIDDGLFEALWMAVYRL